MNKFDTGQYEAYEYIAMELEHSARNAHNEQRTLAFEDAAMRAHTLAEQVKIRAMSKRQYSKYFKWG